MDYDSLSDEELDRLLLQGSGTPQVAQAPQDFDSMSDEQLDQLLLGSASAPEPKIIEEMHPEITVADRLLVKNFQNDPGKSVNYLQKKHPGLEFKEQEGRILARTRGEQDYKVLDPNTGVGFNTELLRDAGDIGYDVVSGVGERLATAAGGLGGFVFGGGIGALPGASAASGAAGAASETLRQALGKMAGVNEEINTDDIKLAGAVSAASPFLFGTDKLGGKQAAKALLKRAAKQNITKEAAEEIFNKSSRGVLKRAAEGVTKGGMSLASGIPRSALDTYVNRRADFKNLSEEGVTDLVSNLTRELSGTINTLKRETGHALGDAIEGAGEKVNISGSKALFRNRIQELEQLAEELPSEATQSQLAGAKQTYRKLFGDAATLEDAAQEIPDLLSPKAAFALQQQLKDEADVAALGAVGILGNRFKGSDNVDTKMLKETSREAYNLLNDEFERVTEGLSKELKGDYKKYATLQKTLAPSFRNEQTTLNTISNLDRRSKRILLERLKKLADDPKTSKLGTRVLEDAELLTAAKFMDSDSFVPLSLGGSTSTSRTIPLAVAGGSIGTLIGYKLGGGYAGATLGGAAGAVIGNALGAPKVIKFFLDSGIGLAKIAETLNIPPNKVKELAGIADVPLRTAVGSDINQAVWELLTPQE